MTGKKEQLALTFIQIHLPSPSKSIQNCEELMFDCLQLISQEKLLNKEKENHEHVVWNSRRNRISRIPPQS